MDGPERVVNLHAKVLVVRVGASRRYGEVELEGLWTVGSDVVLKQGLVRVGRVCDGHHEETWRQQQQRSN